MNYIEETKKYLDIKDNIEELKEGPYNAVFTDETEIDFCEDYGSYHLFNIDFVFDSDKPYDEDEIINNCFYINILYEKKIEEFQKFIDDIKSDNFATICSDVDEEPYYYEYPERLIAYPYRNKVRLIVVDCEDGISLDHERIEHDLLFDKKELILTLERLKADMEKENITKE